MNYSSWREAVGALTLVMRPVTARQQSLAREAGIRIDPKTPSIVASALLRAKLADDLHLQYPSSVDEYRELRIDELRDYSAHSINPETLEDAKTWVEFLQLALRRKHLSNLKVHADDVVELADGESAIISSVGGDGCVYFHGGKGCRTWPDLIVKVLARRDDRSPRAAKARSTAENFAARRKASADWSSVKSEDLSEFIISKKVTDDEIGELERVIMKASDERPIQEFLGRHGSLLAALLGGRERFCIPQKRLGAEFVPDFVVGDTDSLGIRWILVELETPRSGIYLADNNTLDRHARKGVDQIVDWRNWLSHNIAYAHKPRRQEGLGLHDMNGQAQGLVLVGRRRAISPKTKDSKRRALGERENILVHSYDWLLEQLRGAIAHAGPPASNPYLLQKPVVERER